MPESYPLVTILIATKDRADDLRFTLQEMRRQEYPSIELLVIDDGSRIPVEPVVREAWPGATVVRHESSVGQCSRRNEGFGLAKGEFILQLDDDCSLVGPEDLASAIRQLIRTPSAGAMACFLLNSPSLPLNIDTSGLQSGCVAAFVGAAVIFRKTALQQTAGYREFFRSEWEEEELGLQLLSRGWQVLFAPRIVAHHRLSTVNRSNARSWKRGLRNRLWAIGMHMPARRLPFEIGWKVSVGAWDAIRLMRPLLFLQALAQVCSGLPGVWRLRIPLSTQGLRRYDALRLHPPISPSEFDNPPAVTLATVSGFLHRWRNRARNRSAWDRAAGDIGSSYAASYAHEPRPGDARSSTVEK